MATKSGVLLVSKEQDTQHSVRTALTDNERLESLGTVEELKALPAALEQRPAGAVVVDIDPKPSRILQELESLCSRYSNVRFVVLASELKSELVIEAMQAGARHFLQKSAIGDELANVLLRLVPTQVNGTGEVRRGEVLTVLSAGGGCGSTTLAINLANELQLAGPGNALIIDLDTYHGAVSRYLGLKGSFGIADALDNPGRVDADMIRSTAVKYSDDLSVLLSPASVNFLDNHVLDYSNLSGVIRACADAYSYVVVDAPRLPLSVATELAKQSQGVLVTLQLNVKDISITKAICRGLIENDIPADRITAIANRFKRRGTMIAIEEAKRTLSEVSLEPISNDYKAAVVGLNFGQPLEKACPRSSLRRDIEKLAQKYSRVAVES